MAMTPPAPPRLPWPPIPRAELERIRGRLHLTTYCQREAEREYDAFLRGEDYQFQTPDTDADGYLLEGRLVRTELGWGTGGEHPPKGGSAVVPLKGGSAVVPTLQQHSPHQI